MSKKRPFSKNTMLSFPYFVQKNVHSLKNTVFSCPFFRYNNPKNPCCHAHIWSKNLKPVKNTLYYAPKSQGEQINIILAIFHVKISALMPMFCQKNVHSLKNIVLSFLYFVKITSILSKTQYSHVILSNFFMKNPFLSSLYFVKNINSVKKTLYYLLWVKKVSKMTFFSDFSQQFYYPMAIYCQKNVHSLKCTMLSFPYFVKKTSIL